MRHGYMSEYRIESKIREQTGSSYGGGNNLFVHWNSHEKGLNYRSFLQNLQTDMRSYDEVVFYEEDIPREVGGGDGIDYWYIIWTQAIPLCYFLAAPFYEKFTKIFLKRFAQWKKLRSDNAGNKGYIVVIHDQPDISRTFVFFGYLDAQDEKDAWAAINEVRCTPYLSSRGMYAFDRKSRKWFFEKSNQSVRP